MTLDTLSRTVVWLSLFTVACGSGGGGAVLTTVSPDGRTELVVQSTSDNGLVYSVRHDNTVVIDESPLGIETTTHTMSTGLTFAGGSGRPIDESYTMLVGKQSVRDVVGIEAELDIETAGGELIVLIIRVHNDGVAFRYRLLGEGSTTVMSEATGFQIPEGSRGVLRPFDAGPESYFIYAGGYEQPPVLVPIGTSTVATGWAYPALFELADTDLYAMVTEADLDTSYCATRLHEQPDGGLYRVRLPDEREGNNIGEALPTAELPLTTPWRVIIVGDLATVFESTLVEDLSRPSVVEDPSWIAPGRSAWSWFTQDTGTPELQEEYIDFADQLDWEYVLIDAQWDQWADAATTVQGLVSTAAKQDVRLLLWYSSAGFHAPFSSTETPRDRMLDPEVRRAEMEMISGWGIAGIKVDFFLSDKQDRIEQYIGILEDAKDFELLVNFHGSTVPRGWQRTYPHLMTLEAVNGAEQYRPGFDLVVDAKPTAIMNVHLALTRNVIGSMDYTPVTFAQALDRVGLTYAHQLALAVLFESGIQHFADQADANPSAGYRAVFTPNPFAEDFMREVPVTWDETLLLDADIDSHVIVARRKGTIWYIAGIHAGETAAEYDVPLDRFGEGELEVEVIQRALTDDTLSYNMTHLTADETLSVLLQPNDGFVAVLASLSPLSRLQQEGTGGERVPKRALTQRADLFRAVGGAR